MSDRNFSFSDLFKNGTPTVSQVSVYMGLLLFSIGAFKDASLSNRKLLLGFTLISFGFCWFNLTDAIYDCANNKEQTKYCVEWRRLLGTVFWGALTAALTYATVSGHLPFDLGHR